MKREAQPVLSVEGQQAPDQYTYALKQVEDFSAVATRNHLGDLRQFMAWCAGCWRETEEERSFTPQALALPLLARNTICGIVSVSGWQKGSLASVSPDHGT